MDDTLLGSNGCVSVCNAHVIRCMQNVGVGLLVCTGRSYADALLPLGEAGLKAAIVCMNGVSVYDWRGRLIHKQEFVRSQVEYILEHCRNEDVIFDFTTDRGSCTIVDEEEFKECLERDIPPPMAEYFYENIRRRLTPIPSDEPLCGGLEFYKMSAIHEPRRILGQIKERLKAVEDLTVTSFFTTNPELAHIKTQKGKTLAVYAPMKNTRPNQAMAIGNSEDDHSTLFMNLRYTVAMGNTMERIKDTAKCQARTNAQDGVACAIEGLALYKKAGKA